MRPIERVLIVGGIVLAILVAMNGHNAAAVAGTTAPMADQLKLATVDAYLVIEKLMARPDLKKSREDLAAVWAGKASAMERELQDLEDRLKVIPKNDPQAADVMKQAQAKNADYQKMGQDRQQELERMNSTQLIDAYKQVRDACQAVATRAGYTHVMCNRSFDRPIETQTLAATLQELLARPIMCGVSSDDITKQVMTELKVEQ